MDKRRHFKESDSHQEMILKDANGTRGYSYVGKKIENTVARGEIQKCPKCNENTLIKDVRMWRSTGAGLICDICAGVKCGRIVANDNYEVLKVRSDFSVELSEHLKKKR